MNRANKRVCVNKIEGNVLEIHEVYPEYYDFIRGCAGDNYTLTFDDGLYSQYIFLKNNPEVCSRSIVFVTCRCIRNELQKPLINVVLCDTAHAMYAMGDKSPYMSISEICELKKLGVKIGYHSYSHECISDNIKQFKKPSGKLLFVRNDVKDTLLFNDTYGIYDDIFCVPYNDYSVLDFYLKLFESETGRTFRYVRDREPLELKIDLQNVKMLYNREMFKIRSLSTLRSVCSVCS